MVATFVSGILRFLKKLCSEENLVPNENPKVGKSGLGATFVSGTLMFFKRCHPNEILSQMKIRKLEIKGWERLSFLELCCFSKIVIGKHVCQNEDPQVGKSGLGATFVSGFLRLLKNCHPNEI